MGSSMGHWEGDTLVVDTVAIKDRTWLDTKRQIGDRIMDHACMENEKDVINLVPTIGDAGR
jgi:hypothetical protein